MPFVKCPSGFAEVPYQASPFSVPGITLLPSPMPQDHARKRHININFLSGWSWDDPGCVPGISPGLSWDKSGENPGTNPGFRLILHSGSLISPGLSLGQTRFVPGTIPGTKGGTESLCEKNLCAFFARYKNAHCIARFLL